tara:strand:+ start:3807 stop:4010 length:204 start_codon:yes stop_codon:yes gene_type:complete
MQPSIHADMAELVDATDLKSVDLLIVRVRFPLSVFFVKRSAMAMSEEAFNFREISFCKTGMTSISNH